MNERCQAGWWNIRLKRTKSRGFVPLLRGHETAPETKEISLLLLLVGKDAYTYTLIISSHLGEKFK